VEPGGGQKYTQARCLDISASGMRIETPAPIPERSYVSISAEKIGLVTNASVRSVLRAGMKYRIGLEFSCPIKALAERLLNEDERTTSALQPEPTDER
jgi:hypothetical protein